MVGRGEISSLGSFPPRRVYIQYIYIYEDKKVYTHLIFSPSSGKLKEVGGPAYRQLQNLVTFFINVTRNHYKPIFCTCALRISAGTLALTRRGDCSYLSSQPPQCRILYYDTLYTRIATSMLTKPLRMMALKKPSFFFWLCLFEFVCAST